MLARYLAAGLVLVLGARAGLAQTAADHIAKGDSAHSALHAPEAYAHYKEAIALDSNDYEALWKASREAVDLGEFEPDKAKQKAYFAEGRQYAERAVAVKPNDPEGHFNLARALGRVALSVGKKERVKYAKQIRSEALAALQYDSVHPGALHVMGRWNAEIMRLSGFSRFFAKNFLGGGVFDQASWDSAVVYMERSVQHDPKRLVHHLDLGEIYRDRNARGDKERARAELEAVVNGQETDYNDKFYKKQAQADLDKM